LLLPRESDAKIVVRLRIFRIELERLLETADGFVDLARFGVDLTEVVPGNCTRRIFF
jgi:hypothetical protein